MALITTSVCLDIVCILVSILIGVITFFKWRYKYWERLNVPYIQPTIPFGTIGNQLWGPKFFGDVLREQYEEMKKKGFKHVGLFVTNVPMYMPIDLDIIKSIMTGDFNHFTDRGIYFNEVDDPLSAHLFALGGTKWKNLRAKLTPTFTSGKMKMMFDTKLECGKQLVAAINEACDNNKLEPISIKHYASLFTIDIIGSTVFGINCNSFKDPNGEFQKHGQRVIQQTKLELIKDFLCFAYPSFARTLGVRFVPPEPADFFMNLTKNTIEYRVKNKVHRNDFMQLMMELKNSTDITIEEVAAQAFVFFLAGYETSSTTISFCLYELSQNLDIQEKLRDHINAVLDNYDGKITYETIKEMKYLNQVIEEVLRKYPPLPFLTRTCVADYKVPNTDLVLKKGTSISISSYGLHYDPDYFPDPETFDPERFNSENKKNIIPYTYMPFGEGPRLCIGMRFGLMQTYIGVVSLLRNFRFSMNSKTKNPLNMVPSGITMIVDGGIWLNVERI